MPAISAVLPTRDRAEALRTTLPSFLRLEQVDELVVVVDGSRDGTLGVVAQACAAAGPAGPAVRVVVHDRPRGVAEARNHGADEASGEWVVYLEDDCAFPADFARVLSEEALAHDADVVGAPMVHPRPGQPVADAVAEARAAATGDGGLDGVARFPPAALLTPLLQAPALVRTALVRRLRYDPGYVGNGYREETDFFLRAARSGSRCLLTPRTYFWEAGRWSGGQPRHPVRAEWWTLRNNWRFLRRHEPELVRAGLVRSAAREQLAFAGRRARRAVRGER